MKVLLICPSSFNFMPYIDSYNESLKDKNVHYLIWDRFNMQTDMENSLIFRQKKVGHKRGIIDHLLFTFFCLKHLMFTKYDKICIFSPQLVLFLSPFLLFTKAKYIIDYRDYHFLTRYIPRVILKKSTFIVVSSSAFQKFLKGARKFVLSHNINFDLMTDNPVPKPNISFDSNISCIGAIRDYESNKLLIEKLAGSKFSLVYNGHSEVATRLSEYVYERDIKNVIFTGKYERSFESDFYINSDIVNLMIPANSLNNLSLLPNRLYNAVRYRRPMICFEGTAVAEVIGLYDLGCVISEEECLISALSNYINSFDLQQFQSNCEQFLFSVEKEQLNFKSEILSFFDGRL